MSSQDVPWIKIETLIIGGGVVGLAVARALAMRPNTHLTDGLTLLVEREDRLGQHTSSRNSEVIHAGIYYPTQSFKARLCVRGRRLLYDYARAHEVPHRRIEKLIVARPDQDLEPLYQQGLINEVEGLSLCSVKQTRRLEPHITPCESLHSTHTGIIEKMRPKPREVIILTRLAPHHLTPRPRLAPRAQRKDDVK